MEELNPNITLQSVTIFDPASSYHLSTLDIQLEAGKIVAIDKNIGGNNILDCKGQTIYPGMMDMLCNLREPGEEYKEDFNTGSRAALKGGFTAIACSSDTSYPACNKAQIEYIIKRLINSPLDVYPYGSISSNLEGKQMAELYDMHHAGAIGFMDGKRELNAGIISRALLYSKNFNGLIICFPYDRSLGTGYINEGENSVLTGLKSIPALTEHVQVARDLELASYHDSRIHFSMISSSKSVDLIRLAKANGTKVTCGTTPMHLTFNDDAVQHFDTNYKILPPLRTEKDRKALWAGLEDGTIDVIVTDHEPEDQESKLCEFDHAHFGVTGFETCLNMLRSSKECTDEIIYNGLIKRPREILNLKVPTIEKGQQINAFIWDNNSEWVYHPISKGRNHPWINQTLKGQVSHTLKF